MKYFPCTAASSNFNCYSAAKAKDMIDFPSSLQVFALTPDILVVRAKRNRNKYLTVNIQMGKIFITNRLLFLSIASGGFLLTNFTVTLLLESLLYLEIGKRWHPSTSSGSISTSDHGKCQSQLSPDYLLVYHWEYQIIQYYYAGCK